MTKYLVKRVISAIITLFIIATITFFLMNLIPGGPFQTERSSEAVVAQANALYGLDRPIPEQYFRYMKKLVNLSDPQNLGVSFKRIGFTVREIIAEKFPVSARLGVVALCIALGVGIPAGILSALYRNKWQDRAVVLFTTIGIAVPSFVMGSVLALVFGVTLKWLPVAGLKTWQHYIMPSIALSLYPMSYITRLTRSSMLDVLGQDYIRTARAKGLGEGVVLFKHALKNSIIPVITYLGPLTAYILTGGFVVEKIFAIPGLGQYFINSILSRDYPMVMGTTIFLGAIIIIANMVVDILYCVVDPRIRLD